MNTHHVYRRNVIFTHFYEWNYGFILRGKITVSRALKLNLTIFFFRSMHRLFDNCVMFSDNFFLIYWIYFLWFFLRLYFQFFLQSQNSSWNYVLSVFLQWLLPLRVGVMDSHFLLVSIVVANSPFLLLSIGVMDSSLLLLRIGVMDSPLLPYLLWPFGRKDVSKAVPTSYPFSNKDFSFANQPEILQRCHILIESFGFLQCSFLSTVMAIFVESASVSLRYPG